jgi:hypothetical protein
MKEKINSTFCQICEEQLILNYLDKGPKSGICNECGAIYAYDLEDGEIASVEFAVDFEIETEIISEYYEETGQKAYMIVHVEHEKDDASEFLKWARENYPELGWAEP